MYWPDCRLARFYSTGEMQKARKRNSVGISRNYHFEYYPNDLLNKADKVDVVLWHVMTGECFL
jgi:hypothetical protein